MSDSDIFSGLRDECDQLRDDLITLRAENERLRQNVNMMLAATETVRRVKESSPSYLDSQDGCFQ